MNIVFGFLLAMLYLAIGVFLDTLLSNTKPSMIMVLLWPLAFLLALILVVCIYIPDKLAKWIRKKFKF